MTTFIKLHDEVRRNPVYINPAWIICIRQSSRLIPGSEDEWVECAEITLSTLHDKILGMKVTETVTEVMDRIYREGRE